MLYQLISANVLHLVLAGSMNYFDNLGIFEPVLGMQF